MSTRTTTFNAHRSEMSYVSYRDLRSYGREILTGATGRELLQNGFASIYSPEIHISSHLERSVLLASNIFNYSNQENIRNRNRDREDIIAQALETEEGRAALAQSMVEPIRRNLEYQGVGRRLFMVDELPQGALARYEREMQHAMYAIQNPSYSTLDTVPEHVIENNESFVPTFEVASSSRISLNEIRGRRFFSPISTPQNWEISHIFQENADLYDSAILNLIGNKAWTSILDAVPDRHPFKEPIHKCRHFYLDLS